MSNNLVLSKQLTENFYKFQKDLPYHILGSIDITHVIKNFYVSQLELITEPTLSEFINKDISSVFSSRVTKALKKRGAILVKDILMYSQSELAKTRGIGYSAYKEIKSTLEFYNLHLEND